MIGRNHDKGSKYHGKHCKIQPAVNHQKKSIIAQTQHRYTARRVIRVNIRIIILMHRMWAHACTFGFGLQHQLLQKMWYTCLYSKSCSTTVSLSHTSFSEDIVLQLQSVDLSSSTVHSFSQPLLCSSVFYSSVCIDIYVVLPCITVSAKQVLKLIT